MADQDTGLSVIGAGWSRTGTYSLALALTALGFGPCQHMADIAADPDLTDRWRRRLANQGSWEEVYAGFRSAVDWPTSAYAVKLAARYPRAQLILTHRAAAPWYRSFSTTVMNDRQADSGDPALAAVMADTARHALGARPWTRQGWIDAYNAHRFALIEAVSPERLLTYSVHEGWGPLCRFLKRPIPQMPFPRTNSAASFHRSMHP